MADVPPEDRAQLRMSAVGLTAYGLATAASFGLNRAYADEHGGLLIWATGVGSGLVAVAIGAALWIARPGSRRVALAFAVLLMVGGIALRASMVAQSPVPAALLLGGAAMAILFLGQPGKVRSLVGLAGLACVGLLVISYAVRERRQPALWGPPVVFEIACVDDGDDVLATAGGLPDDAALVKELVAGTELHFVRFRAGPGETFAALRRRAETWAQEHASLRKGLRIAWAPEEQPGDTIRSYVVRDPVFVTSVDISDVEVTTEAGSETPQLTVTMGSAATARMSAVTRNHVGRRLAVLLDGIVHLAPLVTAPISTPYVTISLERGTTPAKARGLARALRGQLLHGPW